MNQPNPEQPARKPRRYGRWLRRALLLVLLVVTLIAGALTYLVRTPSASWQRYEKFKAAHTTEQIEAMADELEMSLYDLIEQDLPPELRTGKAGMDAKGKEKVAKAGRPDQLDGTAAKEGEGEGEENIDPSMIRIDEVRAMQLTRDQLTALVASRHEKWLASRGYVKPDEIGDLMIDLDDGRMVASFKYNGRQFSQVFSAKFRLTFDEDGTATVRLESFDAGQLPIPTNQIAQYLREKGGAGQAEQAGEWLQKLDNFNFKPVLDDLPHRRRARILGYTINREQIELTLRVQDFRTYQEMNQRLESGQQTAMVSD